jgi:hypothetical protein
MDPEKFDQQIAYLLEIQARHDSQIQGLIRVAELQQTNLERLQASIAESKRESEAAFRTMREAQVKLDERVSQLVSAIGEWIRRSAPPN